MIVTGLKLANLRATEISEFRFQPGFRLKAIRLGSETLDMSAASKAAKNKNGVRTTEENRSDDGCDNG